jgi:hypothetical protein
MDLENILKKLKPLDFHKETKCLTLLFSKNTLIFLREWEDNKLMWHVFENKQSVDAGVGTEEKIIPIIKNYLKNMKV